MFVIYICCLINSISFLFSPPPSYGVLVFVRAVWVLKILMACMRFHFPLTWAAVTFQHNRIQNLELRQEKGNKDGSWN